MSQTARLTSSKEVTKPPTTFDYIRASLKIQDLTRKEGFFLLFYCTCADEHGGFWRSYKTIGKECRGMSRTTIAKHNNKFREMGILTWSKGCRNGGSNTYQLHLARMQELGQKEDSKEYIENELLENSKSPVLESKSPVLESKSTYKMDTKNPTTRTHLQEPVLQEGATEIFSGCVASRKVELKVDGGEAAPSPSSPARAERGCTLRPPFPPRPPQRVQVQSV